MIHTRAEIEDGMARLVMDHAAIYRMIVVEHERLLAIIGNVENDEVLLLGLLAASNVGALQHKGKLI